MAVWAVGLRLPSTRNLRFVLFGAAWSVAFLVTTFVGGPWSSTLETALVVLIVVAIAAPEYLLVGSVRRGEKVMDAVIEGAPAHVGDTIDSWVEALDAVRVKIGNDAPRLTVAHLRLYAEARRRMPVLPASTTPARYFDLAAGHILHDAQWKRVLFAKRQATAWDQQVVLRCFADEAWALIPLDARVERPIVALGGWTRQVEALLDDLRAAEIQDPVVAEEQGCLIEDLEVAFAMARGDRSEGTTRRHKETSAALEAASQRTSARVRELRGNTDV